MLFDATAAQEVAYVEFVPNEGPRIYQRSVSGPLLRQQIETTLRRPVETITTITPEEATALSGVLFERQ